MNLSGRRSGQPFTAGDEKLVTAIATQIGTAIQINRLVRSSLSQQRLQQEMQLANDLQMKILPNTSHFLPEAQVAARVIPAESVGGDFYHLFRLGEGRTGVMVGDVSSHGYRAALVMALVPIIQPPGGHAIYVDARALLVHIPPLQYPGIALVNALYVEAGIRGVEIGTVMFGLAASGEEHPAAMDLVRLAIPRRVYTQSHIDYVAEAVIAVAAEARRLCGYRITTPPRTLRHFTARFEPIT